MSADRPHEWDDLGPHTETHRRRMAEEAAEVLARGGAWVLPFTPLPARRPFPGEETADA